MALGFVLTVFQGDLGLSDGLVSGLMGAAVLAMLLPADRIEGRPPYGGCCQGAVQESLHPNAYGQRALGRCIALAYARAAGTRWSCRATPGAGTGAIRLGPLP